MRICVFSSHRAERGLLQPLIDRLKAHPEFDLDLFSLAPAGDFAANYIGARNRLTTHRPDAVLIPCDRLEALAAALAAFELGIPIIHFHAGDTGTVSKDETHRHIISLMASVHLCNGPTARETVCDLLESVGRTTLQVHNVGSTAMDDLKIDASAVPYVPYDMVLYNPPTNDPELINRELDEIGSLIHQSVPVCWVLPNGDPGSQIVVDRIFSEFKISQDGRLYTYDNLPRSVFLGFVMRCERFIGNSSSMVCEAPALLKPDQLVNIGDRNKNRSHDDIRVGGSDRIIQILEMIDWQKDFKTGNDLK